MSNDCAPSAWLTWDTAAFLLSVFWFGFVFFLFGLGGVVFVCLFSCSTNSPIQKSWEHLKMTISTGLTSFHIRFFKTMGQVAHNLRVRSCRPQVMGTHLQKAGNQKRMVIRIQFWNKPQCPERKLMKIRLEEKHILNMPRFRIASTGLSLCLT